MGWGDVGATQEDVGVRATAACEGRAQGEVVHEALGEEGVLVEVDHAGQGHVHGLRVGGEMRKEEGRERGGEKEGESWGKVYD